MLKSDTPLKMDQVSQEFNKRATTLLCEEISIWPESKSMRTIWLCRHYEREHKMSGVKVGKSFHPSPKSRIEKSIDSQWKSK